MFTIQSIANAGPQTEVLRRVLAEPLPISVVADYLFLEAWEREPSDNAGVTLRIGQIRRANPALAAAIRAEIDRSRALARSGSILP
jgi:hypothetical protein